MQFDIIELIIKESILWEGFPFLLEADAAPVYTINNWLGTVFKPPRISEVRLSIITFNFRELVVILEFDSIFARLFECWIAVFYRNKYAIYAVEEVFLTHYSVISPVQKFVSMIYLIKVIHFL